MAKPTFWVKLAAAGQGTANGHWDAAGTAITWSDVTPYVVAASWSRGRSSMIDEVGSGTGEIRFKNIDRRFDPSYTAGPYYPLRPYRPINIGCNWLGVDYSLFYGFVENWSVVWNAAWADNYSETSARLVDAIALLSNIGFTGAFPLQQTIDVRINAILTSFAVKFPANMRDITATGTTCKATTVTAEAPPPADGHTVYEIPFGGSGKGSAPSAWEVIQGHVRTTASDLPCWVDRRGFVCYKSTVSSGLTFGDAGSELKYNVSGLNYGVDQLFNQAEVTAEGGVMKSASDGTSILRYGARTISRSTLNINDSAAQSVANTLVINNAAPKVRLDGFQVKPGAESALWAAVIPLDLQQTLVVKRRPPGGGTLFSQTPKVVGVSWELGATAQETVVSYSLSGAAP